MIENLQLAGYGGVIAPVNPKYDRVLGVPCVASLDDLEFQPDVVVFCVGAARVLDGYRRLPWIGARAAVIFDGGFAEAGAEGRQRQDEITAISREAGIALCGPNCMGILNPVRRACAYAQLIHDPGQLVGNAALVSQSGSVCIGMMSDTRRFGFSAIVSSGNEAVVTTADYIDYLVGDPATRVIAVFSEFIADPARFVAALDRAAAADKPVVVLKVGRSEAARRAVTAHTGGLCGQSRVFSEVLRAHRAIEADGLDELTEVLAACQAEQLPAGNRVAAVTASGGLAELMLDAAPRAGIELPPLSDADRAAVERFMGPVSGGGNPLDAWGSGRFESNLPQALAVARTRPDIDAIVFPNDAYDGQPMGGSGERAAEGYTPRLAESASADDNHKPHYQLNTRPGLMRRPQVRILGAAGGATLGGLHQGLGAISRLARWFRWSPTPVLDEAHDLGLLSALGPDRRVVHEHDAKKILRAYGVPTVRERWVPLCDGVGTSADRGSTSVSTPAAAWGALGLAGVVAAASEIGYPVALKAVSDAAVHKHDLGLVRLGLTDRASLERAHGELLARVEQLGLSRAGLLVQPMIFGGVEVLLGVSRDRDFGLTMAVAAGGVGVDLSADEDLALRVLPLRVGDAAAMIAETRRLTRLLAGYRGAPAADTPALIACVEALARLAWAERDRIDEMDINPVIVQPTGQGCTAVDALMVLRQA